MPKRTFWLVTGVAVGAGSSLWVERTVRRQVREAAARLAPDALVVEVGRSARSVANGAGGRVRDAIASGRGEMLRREEELWAELARGPVGPSADPIGAGAASGSPPARRLHRAIGRTRRAPAHSVTDPGT